MGQIADKGLPILRHPLQALHILFHRIGHAVQRFGQLRQFSRTANRQTLPVVSPGDSAHTVIDAGQGREQPKNHD